MPWVADPVIPPCPCGAGEEHQVLRTSGAARVSWHCLWCERGRVPPAEWGYELRELTPAEWAADLRRRGAAYLVREKRRGRG